MNDQVRKPLPHDAAPLHVTGRARYIDDIPLPGNALHLAFGLSPIARGTLDGLDLSAVRAAPGVVKVITAEDLPFENDVAPNPTHDDPLLSTGTLNYVGQPVFIVAATSHHAARFAARQAKWSVTEEEPILTVDAAVAADSYIQAPVVWTKGHPQTAIEAAPKKLSGRIEMGGQEHFYLEGQAALALPQEDGGMLISSSTQHPSEIQHKVAEAIGRHMHAVRVETRRMGGGFGGKESQGAAPAVACAVTALLTGRPAKMRYDRDDDMQITGKRHDFRIDYEVGYDETGHIKGMVVRQYTRCGWSSDLSIAVADRAMLHAENAYLMNHIRIESHRLRTNMCSATAYRGFGGPQGILGVERVIDQIAHELHMDPVEVRRVNYYADFEKGTIFPDPDDQPLTPHVTDTDEDTDVTSRGAASDFGAEGTPPAVERQQTTPYMQPIVDFCLHRLTDRLLESADYTARKAAIAEWNAKNPILKKGLGFVPTKFGISFTLTHLNQAGALVHVYQDGSVHLNHGGTEMGQGLFQKVAQVAASRFGIPMEAIQITATDTAKVPNTSATAASSGSDLNGMAVKAACDTIRDRMAKVVGELHQVAAEDVVFADGMVRAGGNEMSFRKAAQLTYEAQVSLSATGYYRTPTLSWDPDAGTGRPFFYFAHGAALTEVVVDTLTGEYKTLRTDILHDAGASLNPALDVGQVEGGYVQGAGWLTTEELFWDQKGRLRTHAPSTYKIPACSDRPGVFNVALWDEPNPMASIYRSKAVGEPPFVLGIAAFLALSDAIGTCGTGYPMLDAPATPERVLMAVERMRSDA